MSADNRSTHTDALATLGTIITENEKRDAIHLGVDNVIAAETLWPGAHVKWADYTRTRVKSAEDADPEAIGIVDPFLVNEVQRGERFWLVVYPRQITSLRHVWEHPSFPLSNETTPQEEVDADKLHKTKVLIREPIAMAKQAIMDIAEDLGVEYDELMEAAESYLRSGDYWVDGGRFEGDSIPMAFWDHYSVVKEEIVPQQDRGSFLSCSC